MYKIRFNSNWSNGASVDQWKMTTDGGFVGYNSASYIKTPSVSGLTATDASIEFGAELLTTNHIPTQPNSLATKACESRLICLCLV